MPHILLIDDDDKLGHLLTAYFDGFAIQCTQATAPSEGFRLLEKGGFDLVILDVMLPEQDGFAVCKAIRKTSNIPIVMLTARGDVMDRIVGLEIGADDYLPKPFEPRELLVRIQSILKRTQKAESSTEDSPLLQYGELAIDQRAMQVTVKQQPVSLSYMEYELLLLFVAHPQQLLSRDDILNALKGVDADIYSRSVDILVSRLRQKLKPLELIKTIRSRGYLFLGGQAS